MNFYSQHGEDKAFSEVFKDVKDGYFVEVGGYDGKRFSNTLGFEEIGWKGIVIEPHPAYLTFLKANRPKSIIYSCCVSDKNDIVTFYTNKGGALSTLDKNMEDTFKRGYGPWFYGFEPIQIESKTITSILDECNAPKEFELLSIDTEGCDHLVLNGLDTTKYRPMVIMVEYMNPDKRKQEIEIFNKMGYFYGREISNNIIYCSSKQLAYDLEKASLECILIHTENPITGGKK